MCSNVPATEKGGEGGRGERRGGGVVVCIYREQSSQHNFLVPPSGTVSSFRNTDLGLSLSKPAPLPDAHMGDLRFPMCTSISQHLECRSLGSKPEPVEGVPVPFSDKCQRCREHRADASPLRGV